MKGIELKKIYKKSGLTSLVFANEINVSKAQLYILFKSLNVPENVVDKLKSKNLHLDETSIYLDKKKQNETNGKSLPYYSVDALASNIGAFSDSKESVKGYINIPAFADCDGYIDVWGDSMYDLYNSGY